jgi:epoxide hydrolase-like predicted phosphatase
MGNIESVIFDWGGVLIDDPRPGLMRYCAEVLGVSEQDYIRAHNRFSEHFQKGLISEEVFWTRVCGELKRPMPRQPSLWGDAFRSVYSPRVDMFFMVTSLHQKGYKTALISNTEVSAVQYFHKLQYNMFDVLVFSCEQGTTKPERKIYEATLQKLGSEPRQSVLIDDKPEFIDGGKKVGLNAILFQSIDQLKNDLTRLGVK